MSTNNACGCCGGTHVTTPARIDNRPGLDAIVYRIGIHGSFLESMKARLSSSDYPALAGLTARTGDDPGIALLDAWATLADVLTFYQEQLANEGFLRTATERRSVLELARLVGYSARPGVASTVYLAYTVDENAEGPVEIPVGARVQSVPGPGELPQSFETSEILMARKEWNAIKPRLQRPQTLESIIEGTDKVPGPRLYLKGITTNLKPNDALLVQAGTSIPNLVRVAEVVPDTKADRTLVSITPWGSTGPSLASGPTQIRRALLRFSQTNIAGIPSHSLSGKVLAMVGDFLIWLHAQATAQPLPLEVRRVIQRTDLVAHIIEPFDTLREAATSPISDRALTQQVFQQSSQISQVANFIRAVDDSDEGPIDTHMDEVAQALEELPQAGDDTTGVAKQDMLLSGRMGKIVAQLALPRSIPPRSSLLLERSTAVLFDTRSDVGAQAVAALQPSIAETLAKATANARVAPESSIHVFALRQRALLFGSTAPKKVTNVDRQTGIATTEEWNDADVIAAEEAQAIYLDSSYDKLKPQSWAVIDLGAVDRAKLGQVIPNVSSAGYLVVRAGDVNPKLARAEYGVSSQSTRVPLLHADGQTALNWFTLASPPSEGTARPPAFQLIRRAAIYFESEPLELAEEPIDDDICGGDQWIETDQLLAGLPSGRWLVVSGERTDLPDTSGVMASELVMLDAAQQYVQEITPTSPSALQRDAPPGSFANASTTGTPPPPTEPTFLPGDRLHTFIKLARSLSYCYKRDTVTVYANVVKATHGETRTETLGSGDASKPLQGFILRQPPLTYVAAPEPDGVTSTLRVYVNNVQWHEAEALVALGPNDRRFMTRTDDDGKTTVVFGNGERGARLPTGIENVRAVYRNGIGKGGNVKAQQISQLMTRPLGVKAVINPLGASGGADRETRDQARRNAPLAVQALDRLVSTQDYADLARTFAGIGKAVSGRVLDGGSEVVFVTIAGAEDAPIDKSSDLYANLLAAMRSFGDPYQPFRVEMRELLMLAFSARLSILPDYEWDEVVASARTTLLDTFSFERRHLGQSLALSEVIAVLQAVKGVAYVDVEALGAVAQLNADGELRSPQEIALALQGVSAPSAACGRPPSHVRVGGIRLVGGAPRPAQIAFFVPEVPETLILNRIEG